MLSVDDRQRELLRRNTQVELLRSALTDARAIDATKELLTVVLCEGLWRERIVPGLPEPVRFDSFAEFVTTEPLEGLGRDLEYVARMVSHDPPTYDLFDQAIGSNQGARHDLVNNVNEVERPQGNSQRQALRKLRADAPELHEQVLAGELSPHGAMVQAGFRPRTATVRLDDPVRAIRVLAKHFTREQLADALEAIA